ncbi:MAG: RluA family pseudouridine synthase [Lachnospiraceae bacterium]|nr:RluA family pseudouridine synthase [Lachnospiraceae bacterium]
MKLISVQEKEANQRLDKLLARYLKEAPKSFLYKMLRKKNITLNGKKADGSEKVQAGDEIRIFLSDETYEKFAGKSEAKKVSYPTTQLSIIYEDEHILLVNKPMGMLTQKAQPSDVSLNEYVLGYLQQTGQWDEAEGFRPSVCNRLDRNTSGIVVCGKSLAGLQQMAEVLRDRSMHKYYQCLVCGQMKDSQRIEGYLWKNPVTNKVTIWQEEKPDAQKIVTEYRPLKVFRDCTLLEVCLITGRSHQIRAHLASVGHPIIGDYKYGIRKVNDRYQKTYGLQGQLLHSCRLELPDRKPPLEELSGKIFTAELPEIMKKIIRDLEKET